jgi:bacterial/archaeal transporter family-2 protein
MEAVFVPLSIVAGGLLAVQAGANAQLSKATGSPFAATTLQLGVGVALLMLVAGLSGSLGALSGLPQATWWHALGGIASAIYVVSTIVLFPRLGAVVSVGLFIAGQMLASMILDALGLLGVPQTATSAGSAIGLLLVLIGATAIVLGQESAQTRTSLSQRLPWIALALIAGAVLPAQGAVNGLLQADLNAPFAVALTSFVVATLAMGTVMLLTVSAGTSAKPTLAKLPTMPWWGWLGGVAGAIYVTTVFTAIPVIGTATTIGFTVAGQQAISLLVDRYGLFRLPVRPVSSLRLSGVALLLAGVVVLKAF